MEVSSALVGMKDQDLQDSGYAKSVYQVEPIHPSQFPQLTTSSVDSQDRVAVPVQHGEAHSEVGILVKVPVAPAIRVGQKGTSVSRN